MGSRAAAISLEPASHGLNARFIEAQPIEQRRRQSARGRFAQIAVIGGQHA